MTKAYLPLPFQTFAPPHGVCHTPNSKHITVLGNGGYGATNIHNHWYAAYWCNACKRMYMEHYSKHRVHYTYSKRETQAHLALTKED